MAPPFAQEKDAVSQEHLDVATMWPSAWRADLHEVAEVDMTWSVVNEHHRKVSRSGFW